MAQQDLTSFIIERAPELAQRTAEHLMLASVSTLIATIAGITIAIICFEYRQLRNPITAAVGILQTVPSLAMLVFLMTVIGKIGVLPALSALTLYALLPIVRNTIIGLESIPAPTIEAAQGIGMTRAQQIFLVRIPMAMPAIVAGIRTAAVVGVGIATLSAFIGAGGLGEFINRGLALSNTRLILLGAIPAAILAIVADGILAIAEWGLQPTKATDRLISASQRKLRRRFAASLPAIVCLASLIFYFCEHPLVAQPNVIKIGTKHFTESLILGELMAQAIEGRTKLKVERRFDLGGSLVCHGALMRGDVDVYPEYTGTSLATILNMEGIQDPTLALTTVSRAYKERFALVWLPSFGFNNAWAVIVKEATANSHGWTKISDLKGSAEKLRMGLTSEFAERSDGYPGLKKIYGLNFGRITDLDTNIAYRALKENQLDATAGNSTDGRIDAYKLKILDDDKHFFPAYQAAPVAREEALKDHPELIAVFNSLSGTINNATMRQLNYKVDGEHRSPSEVAHEFLVARHLIDDSK
jgi:osmoprotectant transport system permease protein